MTKMKGSLHIPQGFSWFGKNIGIKDDTKDFGGILSDNICSAAAVFTKNTMPGAPVVIGKQHIKDGELQAIIVNSKNANVATDSAGEKDSLTICELSAQACGIKADLILPSSTGVIGKRLPMDVIKKGCESIAEEFGKTEQHIHDFAMSIMTTDTREKIISAKIGDTTILGIAKGAGMIEPNMATMLSYFMTDAEISSNQLQAMLTRVTNKSFNRISVDTDTSTSDTVVVLANGKAGKVNEEHFEKIFTELAIYLAKEIARDGEGASKLIELKVSGASTAEQALLTAKAVVNSPLVKTAIYGADPNWGRFVMAIGKVFNYTVEISDLTILFSDQSNEAKAGRLKITAKMLDSDSVPLDDISELLTNDKVFIELALGNGKFEETVWGCDLTEGYVDVNAHYTT
ncbi:MAG: bifunctional glutamate N-acetyltransferase/amino-acid acetyltransferase ArgJ [Cellvibrionaceae bacterium]